MAKTKYTADQKATALATLKANGGNITYTASLLRIPRKTLSAWSAGNGLTEVPEGLVEEKASELADKLDHIASMLAQELTNKEKIAKASLKDIGVTLGITIDKRNLLRHQPTSITAKLDANRNHYELMVTHLVQEAKRKGLEVSREEAVAALRIHHPDIDQHLEGVH